MPPNPPCTTQPPDADADDENDIKEPPTDPLLNESLSILRDLVVLAAPPSGTAVAVIPTPKQDSHLGCPALMATIGQARRLSYFLLRASAPLHNVESD